MTPSIDRKVIEIQHPEKADYVMRRHLDEIALKIVLARAREVKEDARRGPLFYTHDEACEIVSKVKAVLTSIELADHHINYLLFVEAPDRYRRKGWTRHCLDPWQYLEFDTSGHMKPCCNRRPFEASISSDPDRNGEEFTALKKALLSGELIRACDNCHIRKMVPIEDLHAAVDEHQKEIGQTDLLSPLPLQDIRIDLTTRCNLRCVYCAVTGPGYRGEDMPEDVTEEILQFLQNLPSKKMVHVNGHGETTFHPDWQKVCHRIQDMGHRVSIITNLAKNYSDVEIDTLSQFAHIQVSLDSDDEKTIKKIRKPIRVEKVFSDIDRIRAHAKIDMRKPPGISFSVGVYDPSIWTLENFIDRLIRTEVESITFWNLIKYPHDKHTRNIREFSPDEFTKAGMILKNVKSQLSAAGIKHFFPGDFVDENGVDIFD